jgi:uncharacterized protein (DUF2267 family)
VVFLPQISLAIRLNFGSPMLGSLAPGLSKVGHTRCIAIVVWEDAPMEYEAFIHEVETRLGVDKDKAQEVTSSVLHELHDRLTAKEADDLGAQLPGELKRAWYSFDRPSREVTRVHKAEFVRRVSEGAAIPEDQAGRAVTVVFKVLQMLLKSPTGQEGEAWDVLSQLPKDLKKMWLAASASTPSKAVGTPQPRSR